MAISRLWKAAERGATPCFLARLNSPRRDAVDADFLAAGLGLSTQSLKAEMRRGLVYSVVERGINEDEGRTRLTFRYRARSWTVVVKPDGSLNDDGEPGQYRADR